MTDPRSKEEIKEEILSLTKAYYNKAHKDRLEFKPDQRIPYSGRVFDSEELSNLVDASLEFWLTEGRFAKRFSSDLARYLSLKHCCLVNSGSSANLLAFSSLTIDTFGSLPPICPGDEVITVAAGFPTTVAPIVQQGAIPVFVDISLPTYNIDCAQLEEALSSKTIAVMVAHTLGNPFDVESVTAFCRKHRLWFIEDNCDALGSEYLLKGEWRKTGGFGHVATSSFYPPHHITTGEGGAVYTNDNRIYKNVMSLRDWGRDCWCRSGQDNTCKNRFSQQFGKLPKGYDHKYVYSNFGYNLKMTDLQAAVGVAQMQKLSHFTEARRVNWKKLKEGLDKYQDVFVLPEPTLNSNPSWFGFALTIREKSGVQRDRLVNFLESNHIQTRMLFAGNIIKQPCFDRIRSRQEGYRQIGLLEHTDFVMNNTFWLGLYPGLTDRHIDHMIETIHEFFSNGKSLQK